MVQVIRVLHVDDDPEFADLSARRLPQEDERLEVTRAGDIDEGRELFAAARYDCVVCECEVPGGDALELLREIRQRDPDLPFILFTERDLDTVANEAIAAGVTDYLQKRQGPEQFAILANRITNAVDRLNYAQRFETLVDNLPGVVYRSSNSPEWENEFIRGEVRKLTGYDREALEAQRVTWGGDVIHPNDREDVWNDVQRQLTGGNTFELRYRIVTKDSDTKWVWERGREVDEDVLEGFITDVTAAKEREEVVTGLHDVATDLTTCTSPDAVYRRTIEAAEQLMDFDRAAIAIREEGHLEVVAMSTEMSFDEPPRMPIDEGIAGKTYQTKDAFLIEDIADEADARPRTTVGAAMSVPIGEHGVFQVIDEETHAFDRGDLEFAQLLARHAESALIVLEREAELERQIERLDQFSSIVSHDLRNPLNLAQGHVELAMTETDSEHLEIVKEAHRKMDTLLEDLLELARAGNTISEPEPVRIDEVVQQTLSAIRTADASITIDSGMTIAADAGRLSQLFQNLIRNAIRHAGSSVSVEVGGLQNGFFVEDDGPGIPPDERERIFEAGFTTADNGSGLGLSIVAAIVNAHGWEIDVTTGERGGARFEITDVEVID